MTFDDTTTLNMLAPPRGIDLPCQPSRKLAAPRDLRAAEGIIVSALIGGNAIVWAYIIVRWWIG